jgi:hypothetical protein
MQYLFHSITTTLNKHIIVTVRSTVNMTNECNPRDENLNLLVQIEFFEFILVNFSVFI